MFGLGLIFFSYGATAQIRLTTSIDWTPATYANLLPDPAADTIDTGDEEEEIQVALSSAPSAPVTLTVISSSPDDITANVATITFTTTNFDQTVTVTTRRNDGFWRPLKDISFTFRVINGPTDVPTGTEAVATGQLRTRPLPLINLHRISTAIPSIQEGASRSAFIGLIQVVPDAEVTLTLSTTETTDVSFSPSLLTFVPITVNGTIQNIYSDKAVSIRPINDNLVGTPHTRFRVTVGLHDGPDGYSLNDRSFPVQSRRPPFSSGFITVPEDDIASLVVSPTTNFAVNKGTANTLTVSLPKGPYTGNVVVTVTTDPTLLSLELGQDLLTFTGGAGGDWATPQFVAVQNVNPAQSTPESIAVTFSIVQAETSSSFDSVGQQVVTGRIIDNYTPDIMTNPSSQLPTIKAGATTTFTATLTPPQAGFAVMTISSLNPAVATAQAPVTLTLMDGTVTVQYSNSLTVSSGGSNLVTVTTTTGDSVVGTMTATDTYMVSVTGVSSQGRTAVVRDYEIKVDIDPGLSNVFTAPDAVTLSGSVEDTVSLLVSPTSDFIVNRSGANTLTVSLPKGPDTGNVVVTVTTSAISEVFVSLGQNLLTFTGGADGNWATPQFVAVQSKGQRANLPTFVVTVTIDQNADTNPLFHNVGRQRIIGTIIDDYRPRRLTTNPSSQLPAIKEGETAVFTASLPTPQAGFAVMTISSLNPAIATVQALVTITLGSGTEIIRYSNSLTVSRSSQLVTVTTTTGERVVGTIAATDTYTAFVTGVSGQGGTAGVIDYEIKVAADPGSSNVVFATAPDAVTLSGTITGADLVLEPDSGPQIDINEGEQVTLTVALTVPPESGTANNVTVRVSSDTSLFAEDKDELVFTSANWNIPQQIIVTAADDNSPVTFDRSGVVALVVTGPGGFSGIIKSYRLNLIENSQPPYPDPGYTIIPSSLDLVEGTSLTISVHMNSRPLSSPADGNTAVTNITLGATNPLPNHVTITSPSPIYRVFTTYNWDRPQEFVIEIEDDNIINGQRDFSVGFSSTTPSSSAYGTLSNITLQGTVIDDESEGITFIPNTLTLNEDQSSVVTTVAITLDADPGPQGEVVVTVQNLNENVVEFSRLHPINDTVTFTSSNWNLERSFNSIFILPVNDNVETGNRDFNIKASVRSASPSSGFTVGFSSTLSGTVRDDEGDARFTLSPSDGSALPEIVEGESTTTFTVVLGKRPQNNVVFDVNTTNGDIRLSRSSLTFEPDEWNTAQTVTVTSRVDNNDIDSSAAYTVTVSVNAGSSDDDFDGLSAQTLNGIVTDNDIAGFTLSTTDLGTIAEGGASTSFTVVLDARPSSGNVVLTLTTTGKVVSLSATTLTFTTTNWDEEQTIMVNGENNDITDIDLAYTITVGVDDDASNDAFDGVANQELSGTVSDDDAPGIQVNPPANLANISEGSETTFTVVLNTQPTTDVVIDLTSSDPAIAMVVPAKLTFTGGPTGNSDMAQTGTVTAVDDDTLTDKNYIITVAVDDANSSDDYDTITQELSGIVTNDDTAGFTLSETGLGTIAENGGSTSFTVVLDAEPSSDVELALTTSGKAVSLSAATLTFTSGNWNNEQTIMVTGENNDVADGALAFTVTAAIVDASSDDNFDGLNEELSGIVSDDDDAGFTLVPTGGASTLAAIDEGGITTTFTVVLNTQPVSDVVIDLTSSDTAIATVEPAQLTFDSSNWNTAQAGTVSSGDDDTLDDKNYIITVAVDDANSSDDYDGVDNQELNGIVTNDDAAGFTLSETTLGTISENGGSTSFTVVLDAGPSNNVVLTLTMSGKPVSLSAATLTFTSGNWNNEQTIMVTGENNDVLDGDLAFTVTVAIVDADSDAAYRSVSDQELSGIVSDDDVPGFQLNPSVNLADISEDGGQTTFTVVLNTQPNSGNVVIDLTASDTAIAMVAPAQLTFDSGNWDMAQTGTVTAVDDDTIGATIGAVVESYTITVAVDDANSSAEYASTSVSDRELSGDVTEDDSADLIFEPSTLADITEGGDPTTATVKLSARPSSAVTFAVTSSVPDATVLPTMLIFMGGANYDAEQTITVTPRVDNEESQRDVAYTIIFTATSSDNDFNGITPELQGTVRDDDGLSEEQTEVAIASADTFGTAQIATDLISGHLLAPPAAQPQAQLAGIALGSTTNLPVQSDFEKDPWGNDEDNAWQNDIADLIPGTEFILPLSDTDSSGGHYEIWGAAGYSDLSGDPTSEGEKTEYDGNATGVHIGIGRRYVNGTSFGVSIGSTKVELDIDTGSGDPIKVERDLVSIHPYIGWTLQDGLAAWLIAGYGDGDYEQDEEQTDASLLMLGGGVQRSWSVNGNDVAVRLEGVTTESKLDTKGNLTGESSAWQGRVEFEIGRSFAAAGGGHVQPYGTFGYRYDGGDLGGSGAGEIGLGLRSQLAASWTIDVKSRFQVTDSDHERRSIQGHVKYDRDTDRRGWLLTFSNSFEYEVADADTAAEYTRVLAGSVGYGWSRTLLSQRGTLGLHLKASRGAEQEEPVIGFGFTAPLLRLGLDGSADEVKAYLNYVSNY